MQIMGILNMTPDSFSDGGLFNAENKARSRVEDLFEAGASFVDVGAESTRPGSKPLTPEEEWGRLQPLLAAIPESIKPKMSIDTRNDYTVLKALEHGYTFFNNVSGLYYEDTLSILGRTPEIRYCAMHMHRTPQTMQIQPLGSNEVMGLVQEYFTHCHKTLTSHGLTEANIYLDPGVGFGKTDSANIALMKNSTLFPDCYNLLYGISRKSFIGRLFNIDDPRDRDTVSKAFELSLVQNKVKVIRTHNVKLLNQILGKLDGGAL